MDPVVTKTGFRRTAAYCRKLGPELDHAEFASAPSGAGFLRTL